MQRTLYIYYNEEKTSVQVVRPSSAFFQHGNPSWGGLVEGITMSNHSIGVRHYHSYEVK
jgi:hypothetical protein